VGDQMEQQQVRVRASALVIENDSILLVEFDDENGLHYNLPGGGMESGETLSETAKREAREEASAEIEVGPVAFVYEYEPVGNDFLYGERHSVSVIFDCKLKAGSVPQLSAQPDLNQTGVKWIPLAELSHVVLFPEIVPNILDYVKRRQQGASYIEEKMIQSARSSL
jgi:8-oxo-dGTP diphosphatase